MKVLQLTAHFHPNLGGVETHLNDLVTELQQRSFNIFVLTYIPLTTHTKYRLYEKKKDLIILRIPWIKGFFYRLVKYPILEFLYLLPGLFIVTPFVVLFFKPRVIHSHGLVAGTVAVIWGKLFRKRVIITTHSIYHFPNNGMYHNFVVWLFRNAEHILVLSQQSKHEIESLGISAEKISVFTYWVNQELFKPLDRVGQKKKFGLGNTFTLLFVGRLIEEKGIIVLLDAFNQIRDKMTLLIAGDGPLRYMVQKSANENPDIQYLGRVEQSQLPALYNAVDVLVVPSIHEEGFGRIILESLSCGTPVIASKRGGIVEAMDESVGTFVDMNVNNLKGMIEFMDRENNKNKNKREDIVAFAKKRFSKNNINAIINSYGQ